MLSSVIFLVVNPLLDLGYNLGNRSRGDQKMSHMKSHGIGTKTSLDLILSG